MTDRIPYLKILVRTFYDIQNLRINLGNRVERSETLDDKIKEGLEKYKDELSVTEKGILKEISKEIKFFPIWTDYLKDIRGCGPTMAGVIISELGDILRFPKISSLWTYCGYGLKDGVIQKRKKGEKGNWNTLLKAKLHILAESFIKTNNEVYRELYDNYKNRLLNRKKCHLDEKRHGAKLDEYGCTKGHRHAMALRFMTKIFLKELYIVWWKLEGEDPRKPYEEEFLDRKYHPTKYLKEFESRVVKPKKRGKK